jgi:hypothetical protein
LKEREAVKMMEEIMNEPVGGIRKEGKESEING